MIPSNKPLTLHLETRFLHYLWMLRLNLKSWIDLSTWGMLSISWSLLLHNIFTRFNVPCKWRKLHCTCKNQEGDQDHAHFVEKHIKVKRQSRNEGSCKIDWPIASGQTVVLQLVNAFVTQRYEEVHVGTWYLSQSPGLMKSHHVGWDQKSGSCCIHDKYLAPKGFGPKLNSQQLHLC